MPASPLASDHTISFGIEVLVVASPSAVLPHAYGINLDHYQVAPATSTLKDIQIVDVLKRDGAAAVIYQIDDSITGPYTDETGQIIYL